jgi:hypothetical protein
VAKPKKERKKHIDGGTASMVVILYVFLATIEAKSLAEYKLHRKGLANGDKQALAADSHVILGGVDDELGGARHALVVDVRHIWGWEEPPETRQAVWSTIGQRGAENVLIGHSWVVNCRSGAESGCKSQRLQLKTYKITPKGLPFTPGGIVPGASAATSVGRFSAASALRAAVIRRRCSPPPLVFPWKPTLPEAPFLGGRI